MNTRLEELKKLLKQRRLAFCIKLASFVAISALSVVIYVLFNEELSAFIAALAVLVFCVFQIGVLFKTKTVKIFGKERRGTVVNKGERTRVLDRNFVGGVGFRADRVREFSHDMTRVIISTLYIEDKNGKVWHSCELDEDQTEFYEVGDEVVVLAGAKYPLVLNEPKSRQKWLCPICGTVSPDGVDCPRCGLEFK